MVRVLRPLALPAGPALFAALREAWEGGPALLPVDPGLPAVRRAALVEALGGPVPDDVAVVIATSGSTGTPKGVELTRAALEASARAGLERLGATGAERWLCCLPPSSVGGLMVLVRSLVLGVEPVLLPRFDVAAVAAADARAVALVPTLLARLLDAEVDLARFRHVLLGGAAAPPALLARAAVTTTYGMSETCGGCVYDGVPLRGVEVEIDDDARIRLRGPVLARAYRDRPLPLVDGWLVTGDVGHLVDGRLEVLGRADDVLISGGTNVAPARVEAALATHPAIAEVAVVGRPDPEWGQRVVAVVVPRPGARVPDLPALRAFLADRLAPAELPRELRITDRLPLLGSGKVDRRSIG